MNNDELAGLMNKVVGKKVGVVKLCDWDEVTQQIARLYEEELGCCCYEFVI